MSQYNAPTSKGTQSSSSTQPRPILPGHIRFRKPLDFGNSGQCFDLEEQPSALAVPVVTDEKGRKILPAGFMAIVDPCQVAQSPLKTVTVLTSDVNIPSAGGNLPPPPPGATFAYIGAATARFVENGFGSFQLLSDLSLVGYRTTSAINTANAALMEIRNLAQIISIHMVASAATATLLVEASQNNSNFLQIDSIAAALTIDLQYTLGTNALNGAAQAGTVAGTGASTVKLNPLGFRFIRITSGAAGAGNTVTMDIGVK